MAVTLAESYGHCRRVARKTGKNFYYSFLTLPRPLADDMCVLYAFLRHTDDLGDDSAVPLPERRRSLDAWRGEVADALAGRPTQHPVFPALREIVARHGLTPRHLEDVIDGVESDLVAHTFQTFVDLEKYTYQVAGAVGLCCIQIWGYTSPDALLRAVDCGTAFQLTNILRDLQEDALAGRIYLPTDDLARFGYSADDLRAGVRDERFRRLMRFETERARHFYAKADELIPMLSREGRRILGAMIRIYRGLLDEIERRDFDVFSRRVSLSRFHKLRIAISSCLSRD